jgi:16S rRNA (guanine966-N2)-methyltransferase
VRIVAGTLRGRRIAAPAGRDTRPTPDRVREALFSILGSVEDEDVLDVFAGSGALAFEALSRGARTATVVERAPRAVACIRSNAEALGVAGRLRVVRRDWRSALAGESAASRWYGVVLADPPYSLLPRILGDLGPAIAAVASPGASVVIEHAARHRVESVPGLDPVARIDRVYGDTALCVLRLGDGR